MRRLLAGLVGIAVVAGILAAFGAYMTGNDGVSAQADEPLPDRPDVGSALSTEIDLDIEVLPPKGPPRLESALWRLVEAERQGGAAGLSAEAQHSMIALQDGAVRVIIVAKDGRAASAIASARSLSATVETSHGDLVQVLAPVATLERLADDPSVRYVRQPFKPQPWVISEGVPIINADDWQAAGIGGSGVKVAVPNLGFQDYTTLLGTELPASVTTQSFRADGDITGGGEDHGTAVAEIVHDVAPDAQMYLVNQETDVEFLNAVDWLIAQDVDAVNFSAGWSIIGPGDGTGYINDKVSEAVSSGIVWANAAGNAANNHWADDWYDPDVDSIHNFASDDESNAVYLFAGESIWVGLKWDDPWDSSCNDYDLYLFNSSGIDVQHSWNVQDCSSAPPVEALEYTASSSGVHHILIHRYSATRGPFFHLYVYPWTPQYVVAAGSLSIPADNADAVTVGAVDWSTPSTIESFSSQGPTEDGRPKPDLVAPDYVSGATYGPSGFPGTSAASPHVAGAAALVKEAYPSYSPAQIKSFLEGRAVDLGPPGKDDVYGSGRLDLGPIDEPDVLVAKEDDPDPVCTGAELTYDVGVANFGSADASNVTVVDTLPAGTTFLDSSPGPPTCTHSGGVVTCNLGTVVAGADPEWVTIYVLAPGAPGVITNHAEVSASNEPPGNLDNNQYDENTTVEPCPDVMIAKEDDPDPVCTGAELTYDVGVANFGSADASNVTVVDTLPAGTTFLDSSPGPPTCTHSGGVVTCNLGTVVAGADPEWVTIYVLAPEAAMVITNHVEVSASNEPPENFGDNEYDESTTVEPYDTADVKVLDFWTDPPEVWVEVSQAVVVSAGEIKHNNGPSSATASAWWSIDNPPQVNVRWLAQPGDECTLDGEPVPCDSPGDINDLHFEVPLPVSETVPVGRDFALHCKEEGDFMLPLWNEEWPIDMDDPDPDNNWRETQLMVHCGGCGDVDCDDDVDAVDALFILQYVVELRDGSDACPPPLGALYLPACDVDCDDDCDAVDALFVLQHVVSIRPDLCVCAEP